METKVGRIRLSEQVEDAILKAIASGEFPVGTKLPSERVLMDMFEVGRPSVKEALVMLEQKGFVRLRRGVAPVVIAPTPERAMASISDMVTAMVTQQEHWQEFYELRIMLEVFAVMSLAKKSSSAQLENLTQTLQDCARDVDDPESFRLSELAFHKQLVEATNNSVAIALHAALIEWGMFSPDIESDQTLIHQQVLRQHILIAEAIRSGDVGLAAVCLTEHLSNPVVPAASELRL